MTKKNIINGKSILSIGLVSIAIAIAIAIITSLGIDIDIFSSKVEAGQNRPEVAAKQLNKTNLVVKASQKELTATELKTLAGALAVKSLPKNLLTKDLEKNEKQLSLKTVKTLKLLPLKVLDKGQHSLDLAVLPSLVKLQLSLKDLG